MVVNRDDKTTSSIDFTVSTRSDLSGLTFYDDIRCLNLESFDTGNVGSKESIFSPTASSKFLSKCSIFSSGTPLRSNRCFTSGRDSSSGVRRFLGFFHKFIQIVVDIADGVIVTILTECITDKRLERCLLILCSKRCNIAKYICNKVRLEIFWFLGVVQT